MALPLLGFVGWEGQGLHVGGPGALSRWPLSVLSCHLSQLTGHGPVVVESWGAHGDLGPWGDPTCLPFPETGTLSSAWPKYRNLMLLT